MTKTMISGGLLAFGLLSGAAAAAGDGQQIALPLSGPAYYLADDGYKAHVRGDHAVAITKLQEAIRLRPDVARLKDMLNRVRAAKRASVVTRTGQRSAPAAPAPGYRFAAAAYKAGALHDHGAAIEHARAAVQSAPENPRYRLLLVNALIDAGQFEDADLALQKTDPSAQRNVRLIIADAALAPPTLDCSQQRCALTSGQAARDPGFDAADLAYKALDARQYGAAIEAAEQAVRQSPATRSYRLLLVQTLLWANLMERAEQAADAALAADADVNAGKDSAMLMQRGRIRQRLGQQALAQEDFDAALRSGDLAPAATIVLLHESGRTQEARLAFDASLDNGALADLDSLELAYLAARVGANEQAHAAFARADLAGTLPETALEDAAFTAIKCGRDEAALGYFRRAIDAVRAQQLSKEAQALFNTQRAVATIERSGGIIASLSSGTGQASNAGAAPGAGASNQVLQAGTEGYWRPFGYQNGRTLELFGRVFETLRADDGSPTGAATAQGTLGARWKPLAEHNLVLSFGRLIPLGSQAASDWLAQAGYSTSHGTDLRVDVPSWWTAQGFGEIGRYLQNRQNYAIASAQLGRSYRIDVDKIKLVLFPHLTMNLDYNARSHERTAVGTGPGVNLRYWWRDNAYAAPASFVDLSLQYRLSLGAVQRARGWFISANVSY